MMIMSPAPKGGPHGGGDERLLPPALRRRDRGRNMIYIYIYIYIYNVYYRKSESIHHHHHHHHNHNHHHHHHQEGVVYRSFCLSSSAFAVSKVTSRRWWCVESLFPQSDHRRR